MEVAIRFSHSPWRVFISSQFTEGGISIYLHGHTMKQNSIAKIQNLVPSTSIQIKENSYNLLETSSNRIQSKDNKILMKKE